MFRIIGVILICSGTAMIGFRAGAAATTRSKVLASFVLAVDIMSAEISCMLTPLREILEKLLLQLDEPVRRFFYRCLSEHTSQKDSKFSQIWTEQLNNSKELCLRECDIQLLSEIGNTFGHYSGEEQVRVLQGIRDKLEKAEKQALEDCAKNGRLYRSLGITCGIALVILLI